MKRRKRSTTSTKNIAPVFEERKVAKTVKQGMSRKKLLIILCSIAVTLLGIIGFLYYLSLDLPSLKQLEHIDPELATKIFDSDGNLISTIYSKNRTFTPYNKIPKHVIDCLLATEDRRFYDHWGFDLIRFTKAAFVNLRHMSIQQGGSTLTQQLARNLYLGLEQTITRKLREILTAIQIERTYSKTEIIEMYLNINPFGHNTYGIHAAARYFFSKDVSELTIEEGAVLIGVLNGQTIYNPIRHPDKSQERRNVVLYSLYDTGKISRAEYDSLKILPLKLSVSSEKYKTAPYFVDYIEKQLFYNLEDSLGFNTREDGLYVYTTLNSRLQHLMEQAIAERMPAIQERVRNTRDISKLREEFPNTAEGDSLFKDSSTLQIAFVCIDPKTGHVLAMVGGRDYDKYKFNNATMARRQPGSAFKPFIYTAAINDGHSPNEMLDDRPYVLNNPDGEEWRPQNYDKTFGPPMPMREALRRSRNLPAVWLIDKITPQSVVKYAKAMGITTTLRAFPSLALGTSEVIPLDLISSYGIFANDGVLVKPVTITRIEDKTRTVIYTAPIEEKRVLSEETTFIMNDLLQNVANNGTGATARTIYKVPYNIPIGGKTGTTNDNTDAWFVGFTPSLVAGVWVGFSDSQLKHGLTGSQGALPFWATFIKSVYDSIPMPNASFPEQPPGVVKRRICSVTKKLATEYCPTSANPANDEEYFILKYLPEEHCEMHSGKPSSVTGRRKAF